MIVMTVTIELEIGLSFLLQSDLPLDARMGLSSGADGAARGAPCRVSHAGRVVYRLLTPEPGRASPQAAPDPPRSLT